MSRERWPGAVAGLGFAAAFLVITGICVEPRKVDRPVFAIALCLPIVAEMRRRDHRAFSKCANSSSSPRTETCSPVAGNSRMGRSAADAGKWLSGWSLRPTLSAPASNEDSPGRLRWKILIARRSARPARKLFNARIRAMTHLQLGVWRGQFRCPILDLQRSTAGGRCRSSMQRMWTIIPKLPNNLCRMYGIQRLSYRA